ncbi:hypothetical protein [Nonomuraea sp. bgisy101]|uniref:hypothetical protein n=1 Tax=Nonomuraea sp. bgisy101 TaxID=3413784 RepID=UPI003D728291
MPTFTTSRYRQLQVRTSSGTVRFDNGHAIVTDEQAEVLRAMDPDYALVETADLPSDDQEDDGGTAQAKAPAKRPGRSTKE